MKFYLLILFFVINLKVKSQSIDSIYLNLYTDSLKKGTYNYINVDGLLSDGRYLPLDSTQLIFKASHGYFLGNSVWVEPDFIGKKITISVALRKKPALCKSIDIWIKQLADGPLITAEELMKEMKNNPKRKTTKN